MPSACSPLRLLFRTLLLCLLAALVPLPGQSQSTTASALSPAARQPDRVLPSASLLTRVPVPGHHPAWATPSADRGALSDSQPVQLVFALRRDSAVQAAFEQLLADQQNPASPRFHQWLTPQQVGEQFGPTQHDLAALTSWLAGQGFTVDTIQPSRIFINISAPAAVVAAALGSPIHTYASEASTNLFQAPVAEPTLPAALSPLVAYIGGLTSVPLHTFSHPQVITTAAATGASSSPHPSLTTSSGNHFLTPADFASIYDLAPLYTAGVRGAGQRVMILGGSRLNPADLALWQANTAQLAQTPTYLVGTGFTDPGQTNGDGMAEGTLDFERVTGTAPGAAVDMVIAGNWLAGAINTNLLLYAINTVNDPILSLSFGSCEAIQTRSYIQYEDSIFAQAAAQGISVFVSSGDAGVTGCAIHDVAASPATQQLSINDLCASSYVTCVGGTQFNDTASPATYWNSSNSTGYRSAFGYIPEGAWNEPVAIGASGYVVAGSGGGPSTVIPKPTWQTGTGMLADGARDTPDLSFSAASHDGYFSCLAYAGGSCVPGPGGGFSFIAFGGTSASAPSMAGIAALLDGKLGARQGNLNPALYALAASTPATFHDATVATSGVSVCNAATPSPCNNSTPAPASLTGGIPGYLLTPGYDLVTGLGSLDASAFVTALSSPAALPATVTTLTLASPSVSTQASETLTASVSPAANALSATVSAVSGTVQFSTVDSTGALSTLGAPVALNGGARSSPSRCPPASTPPRLRSQEAAASPHPPPPRQASRSQPCPPPCT